MFGRQISSFAAGAILASVMVVHSGRAFAQDAIDLSPRLKPGEVRYVEIVEDSDQLQKGGQFGEEGVKTTAKRIRTCRRQVEPRSEGGQRVVFTYDRLAVESTGRSGPTVCDTDQLSTDFNKGPGSLYAAMLGKSFTLLLDGKGAVESASGMVAIRDAAVERTADMMLFTQMEGELTDELARFSWGESTLGLYAGKPVKPGDTWKRSVPLSDLYLGDLVCEYECRFESLATDNDRPIAAIAYRASVTRKSGGRPGARLFFSLTEDVAGTIEGYAAFDLAASEIVRQDETLDYAIKAVSDGVKPGDTNKIDITRKIHRVMRVLSDADRTAQRSETPAP